MFMNSFDLNCRKNGKDVALVNAETGARVSYEELSELSGRVYGYLKQRGIGRESVVMISLPRGVQPFIALIGIWRAGAAAIMLDADYAKDRQQYIYEDAGCVLRIDNSLFIDIMESESQEGYEQVSPHDLCYIVYTSGTTGKPKGVMHEFGMLDMCVAGSIHSGQKLMDKGDRFALSSPLYFVASLVMAVPIIYHGGTLVVLPMDIVRNPERFVNCLDEYQITMTFTTPSMMKHLSCLPKTVKKVILGGEPVSHIYYPDVDIYCQYAQSESCFVLSSFLIEREYDITPVGKAYVRDADVCILDENGNPLKDGEKGIICYRSPYFRGYLGMDKATAKARIKEYTSTGDLGYILPDGNMVLMGRNDDMIKIRGNRVEPAEVENVVSTIMQVEWVRIRAFKENETTYMCAYYIEEPVISISEIKEKLKRYLPSYMIPSFFVKLDKIPLNKNGKFSRKDLPKPDIDSYRTDYTAPTNQEEMQLCRAMEKALHIDRVGIMDDFYEMGGDSISVMEVLSELNWPMLDVSTILKERSPQKIAEAYSRAVLSQGVDIDERNQEALSKDQPLMLSQLYMFDYQCYVPKSTTWNLYTLLRFPSQVDVTLVKTALEKVLRAHPVFSTIYCFNEDTDLVQRYMEDMDLSVDIEELSEAEFVDVMESLLQPFKLLNHKLYRARLFKTERGGYLYLDLHHSIADGTSMMNLIRDLCAAYEGKEPEPDYYYLKVVERRLENTSPLYEEGRNYYTKLLDQNEWDCYPETDAGIETNSYGNLTAMIPIEKESYEVLQENYGISKNAFFITVALLAISIYNQKSDIKLSWIYNGREKETDQNIIGTLIKDFYVGVHLKEDTTMAGLYKDISDQIKMNLVYSCYPYPGPERMDDEGIDASLLYQQNLRDLTNQSSLEYSIIDIPKKVENADNLMDIEIHDTNDGCKLYIDYIAECYHDDSIHRFRRIFIKTACLLIQHLQEPGYMIEALRKEVNG